MSTLVIGGGLIGLTTAYALRIRGEDVILVEAREGVALETSFANGGLLTPSMPEPWNGPGVFRHLAASLFDPRSSMRLHWHAIPAYFGWGLKFLQHSSPRHHFAACTDNYHLAKYSLERTAAVSEALGLDYDRGTKGTLSIFRDRSTLDSKQAVCRHVASLGMQHRMLDADEVVELEPSLSVVRDRIICGTHFPDDNHGDAQRFCRELLTQFESLGGAADFGMTISSLVVEGGRLRGVMSREGFREANRVIVAAGARSPALMATGGLKLPVKPVKGYSVTVETDDASLLPSMPVVDDSMHACLTPFGSRLRMVGTAEFTGFDTRIDPVRTDNLYRLFEDLLPDVAARVDKSQAKPWAGLRPMSYDGKPFIGGTGIDGLYVNSGHGPLGWTLAMGSAELLADVVTGAKPAVDPRPYSIARRANAA